MWNVSAETHLRLCERKIWFANAQESKHDLKCESSLRGLFPFLPIPYPLPLSTPATQANVKVIHYPCNYEPSNKIGRLSPNINIELNLFQELESAVLWSDG